MLGVHTNDLIGGVITLKVDAITLVNRHRLNRVFDGTALDGRGSHKVRHEPWGAHESDCEREL